MFILFRAVTAFDDLKNLGARAIAFEDDSTFPTTTIIMPIPEGRSSIIYRDQVYDWYGRPASRHPRIKRVILPYGHRTDYSGELNYCADRFIAELNDTDEYAITELKYHAHHKIFDPKYIGTRYAITGGALDRAPYIDFDENNIIKDPEIIAWIIKNDPK